MEQAFESAVGTTSRIKASFGCAVRMFAGGLCRERARDLSHQRQFVAAMRTSETFAAAAATP
jgi:hypothetical protein